MRRWTGIFFQRKHHAHQVKRLFAIAFMMVISHQILGQDIHLSQYFFSPQLLSPAEIGNFDARYRLNANYKSQWKQVSRPYSTFAIMGDAHHDSLPKELGLGLTIMNDHTGDSEFNTLSFLLGGSYSYDLTLDGVHSVRGGLQLGFTQIKIDYNALSFNNQYNGVVYDPSLPSGENFARDSRWYFNLNAGLGYTFAPERRKSATFGFAMHNLSAPKQSFYNDTGVKLPLRTSFYINAEWKVFEEIDIIPTIRYMDQATFSETIFGSSVRYILMDERTLYRSVFAGYYGRFSDSGIAMIGFELDDWRFAASYDINVSDLETASRNRGGIELSLQYLMGRTGSRRGFQHKYCPVFL
jgi:type IX secretion system PorP/SprF family membrane protein